MSKLFNLMRDRYFRRDGKPYKDVMEWAADFKNGDSRRVKADRLWWGGTVSTVHLGLDHGFGGPPLIFETMVFPRASYREMDMDRYTTEAEAVAGHDVMKRKWSNPLILSWELLKILWDKTYFWRLRFKK